MKPGLREAVDVSGNIMSDAKDKKQDKK